MSGPVSASTIFAIFMYAAVFTEEGHHRDEYDPNCVGTKVAKGCFFLGTKVTEGFSFRLKNVSLLDPVACYVNALSLILDLKYLQWLYLELTLQMVELEGQ